MSKPGLPDSPDADVMLTVLQVHWEQTHNPYHAWNAVATCAAFKKELPRWVFDYLASCAFRLLSPDNERADLRKILPRVFGFPAGRKGHHPLRIDGRFRFEYRAVAQAFADAIEKGAKQTQALHKAANALPRELLEIDNKTLLAHIKKYYGVTNNPRSNSAWKTAIQKSNAEDAERLALLAERHELLKALAALDKMTGEPA